MEFEVDKDTGGQFMWLRTRGVANVDALEAGFASVFESTEYETGLPVLADHRELKVGSFQIHEMRRLVSRQSELRRRISGTRVATLVSSPVVFGMARMWISVADAGDEFQIFRDEVAALKWLLEES